MADMGGRTAGGKIAEFEALRGALALWVVASHVLQFVGVRAEANPITRLVNMGGLAADGFVIL